MVGQIAFNTLLRRLPDLALTPAALQWRGNTGLRGLTAPADLQRAAALDFYLKGTYGV